MSHTFETVDEKVAETEFFLARMIDAGGDWDSFRHYLSAYLSAARTTTLALQRFSYFDGFDIWYETHRERLKADPLAKFILNTRNDHVHGGPSPVAGTIFNQSETKYQFQKQGEFVPSEDIVSSCRRHFIDLLNIVYDCYVVLGEQFDPQQYYTRECFESIGKSIDDAEVEVWGWVMTSLIAEGLDEDDRWQELRGHVGECSINHLFNGYFSKVTPQPILSEMLAEFEFTHEDRGWTHIPAGFKSTQEYLESGAPNS